MKKTRCLAVLAVITVFAMSFAINASATQILDPTTFTLVDPVSYEARLSEYPDLMGYTVDLDFVNERPSDLTYVSEATPFGTDGYLSHKAANDNAGLFQVGVGDSQLNSFAWGDPGTIPANLGRQKIEVIFRIDNFPAGLKGDILDIRNFYITKDGTSTKVIGMKMNDQWDRWWYATLNGAGDLGGGSQIDEKTWYKMVIYTDIPRNLQNTYLEKWDAASGKFVVSRAPFDLNDERSCDGMNVQSFANSVRVRFANAMDWDIAQIKITRDNTLLYKQDPHDPANDEVKGEARYLLMEPGVITNANGDGGTTVVARTYIAGNALGEDGTQNPTSWYTYSDGSYEPKATNPVLMVAQYDNNGSLIDVKIDTVELPTLNAGYRSSGVECNPTIEETTGWVERPVLQHELEFKKLELRAPKADGLKTAKVFLWGGLNSLTPLTTVEKFTY